VSLPSSYRSRRGHVHLPRVLPLVGCLSKIPTAGDVAESAEWLVVRRLVVMHQAPPARRPGRPRRRRRPRRR
jgi:hypothetical protein